MNILITGSAGFAGRNLVENIKNIRDGKNRTRPDLTITTIYEYDTDSPPSLLEEACAHCDFVFHLAGVNRPEDPSDFMKGNFGFTSVLLDTLKKYRNTCPVMLASSVQASLTGRFAGSEYGKSKLAGEELLIRYGADTGAPVLIYRFPNLFGKWCRPNYNSAVATFCHAVANDLPYTVNDRSTELELVYIDDLVEELLDALEGKAHGCPDPSESRVSGDSPAMPPAPGLHGGNGVCMADIPADGENGSRMADISTDIENGSHMADIPTDAESGSRIADTPAPGTKYPRPAVYCHVPVTHHATLGEIVDLLLRFKSMPQTLIMPQIPENSFEKKLYSTYLSYLPAGAVSWPLDMKVDSRGVFTELLKTESCGQVSINIARPGNVRGEHWHNSKWEIFIVVAGHGLIRERRIGKDPSTGKEYPVIGFEVTGEQMRAVQMLPGYAHSITNLSETENLVTVMWANEPFDAEHPDTFYERVTPEA